MVDFAAPVPKTEEVPWFPKQGPSVTFTPVPEQKPEPTKGTVTAEQLRQFSAKHFGGDLVQAEKKLQDSGYGVQRPTVSISQLSAFADKHFEGDEDKAAEALQAKGYQVQKPLADTLEFKLYTPWGDLTLDTGFEISPEASAAVSGFSRGLTDMASGIQQLTGLGEDELKRQEQDWKATRNAAAEQGVDTWYEGGKMAGFIADPVAFAVPFAKAKSLGTAAVIGTGYGAAFGGLSYVDEGQTRLRNMMYGAVGGGLLTPAMLAIGRGMNTHVAKKTSNKVANDILDMFEQGYAQSMAEKGKMRDAMQKISTTLGVTSDDLSTLTKITGRKLHLPVTVQQAQEFLAGPVSVDKADTWLRKTFGPVVDTMSSVGKTTTYLGKPVLDRIQELDPKIYRLMVKNMQWTFERGHKYYGVTDTLFKTVKKELGDTKLQEFKSLLFRADASGVTRFLRENPAAGLDDAWEASQGMYKQIANEMRASGIKFKELDFYFPRIVQDKRGLFKALGTEQRTALETALSKAKQKKAGKLTELEEMRIINNFVFGPVPKNRVLSHEYNRKMAAVAEKYQQFYADPLEAAHTYVRNTLDEISFRKMVKLPDVITERNFSKAIKDFAKVNIKDEKQVNELSDLLTSVYYYSRKSSPKWVQAYKSMTHGTLLNDVFSAVTQLQDFGLTATKFTVRDTIQSMFGKKMKAQDWGLVDSLAEEFVGSGGLSKKFADISIKGSGMTVTDRLGKNNFINTAFDSYARKALTVKGKREIFQKWGDVFGDDIHKVIQDLAKRKFTPDTKTLIFAEVADIYPIGPATMPQAYANHPIGRLGYTLASYQVKFLNFVYKNVAKSFASGNKAHALKTLTKLILVYGSLGIATDVIKDIGKGREIDPERLLVNNGLKIIGMNKYTMDKFWDEPANTFIGSVLPPTGPIDDTVKPLISALDPDAEVTESQLRNAVRNIPWVGELIANWFLGGAEAYNKR